MKYHNLYIKNSLTNPKSKSEKFLKELGGHSYISSFCKELEDHLDEEKDLKDNFLSICDMFYKKYSSSREFSKLTILKNIFLVNSRQYKRLKKLENENGTISFDDHQDKNDRCCPWRKNKIKITFSQKVKDIEVDIHKRSIVMYFRGHAGLPEPPPSQERSKFGVDVFQFLLIYYFLERYINENKSCVFNDIYVVSRFNFIPKLFQELFPNMNHKLCSGENFIVKTSFFANTLHFIGGRLPDVNLFTIPILCEGFRIQNTFMRVIKSKVFLPFFFYNGHISKTGKLIPDNDREYCRNGKFFSWNDVVGKIKLKEENYSVDNIFKNLQIMIKELETKLIEDNV